MNFLLLFILIFLFECHLSELLDKEIVVDFNETNIEIDLNKPNGKLLFVCVENCKLVISKRAYFQPEVSVNENNFTVTINQENLEFNGELRFCKINLSTSSFVDHSEIPDCCPCCSWYIQMKCNRFSQELSNQCSTIILYFNTIIKTFRFIMVYDKVHHLLPCKMPRSGMKDGLKIFNEDKEETYFDSSKYLLENSTYYPSRGFCFNTSAFEENISLKCYYYNRSHEIMLIIKKINYIRFTIKGSVFFIHEFQNSSKYYSFQNNTNLKLLNNRLVKFGCGGKVFGITYFPTICMKFNKSNIVSVNDYDCENTSEFVKTIIINTKNLKNLTRFSCYIDNPSRTDSKTFEFSVEIMKEESLEIVNGRELKDKEFKIFEDQPLQLNVSYNSVPANTFSRCELVEIKRNQSSLCKIEFVGHCICRVKFEFVYANRITSQYLVVISNERFQRSVPIYLQPIYINEPTVSGLTSKFEKQKTLTCNVNSSSLQKILWLLTFNENERYYLNQSQMEVVISINDSVQHFCASCEVTNELGPMKSEKICKNITDIEFDDDQKFLQIFLVNATTWNSKLNITEKFEYLSYKQKSILVLNDRPIEMLCAGKVRKQPIKIRFNNSILNQTIFETKYTKRSLIKLHIESNKTRDFSGTYICEQTDLTRNSTSNSSLTIEILQGIIPQINQHNFEWKFIPGQTIQVSFLIISLPPANVKYFRVLSNGKKESSIQNRSHDVYMFLNLTHSIFKIKFPNIDLKDSGEYVLEMTNIFGEKNTKFYLKFIASKGSSTIYYTISGACIIFTVILILLIRFCQRSGYAVPIIQIQNSMYKSFDYDSIQLLAHIWPDPLDRKRWTIAPSRVKINIEIGKGNYGRIFKGILTDFSCSSQQLVAIKQPILTNQNAKGKQTHFCQISLDCFMNEIKILSKLTECPNIIKMIGCAVFENGVENYNTTKETTTLLILEYYSNRSLNEFLLSHSIEFSPYTKLRKFTEHSGLNGTKLDEGITLLDLKTISMGIATGLEYLGNFNIIHRDLATRNILLDENRIPKICDFGLAIELENNDFLSTTYQIITYNKALPFKILAPEVLETKSFCLKSDIWSFGLLLWQMFNLEQETLFPDFENPIDLLKYIRSRLFGNELREFLSIPKCADSSIWDIMKMCWAFHPIDRPSASLLKIKLMEIVSKSPIEDLHVNSFYQTDTQGTTSRDSIGSSKYLSTRTSIVTLNFPPINPGTNPLHQNPYFFDESPM